MTDLRIKKCSYAEVARGGVHHTPLVAMRRCVLVGCMEVAEGSLGRKVVTRILHDQKKQHSSVSLWGDLTWGVPENSKAH